MLERRLGAVRCGVVRCGSGQQLVKEKLTDPKSRQLISLWRQHQQHPARIAHPGATRHFPA